MSAANVEDHQGLGIDVGLISYSEARERFAEYFQRSEEENPDRFRAENDENTVYVTWGSETAKDAVVGVQFLDRSGEPIPKAGRWMLVDNNFMAINLEDRLPRRSALRVHLADPDVIVEVSVEFKALALP